MSKLTAPAATAALAALLAACAGPTDYRPASGPADTGYAVTQVAADRYLVRFEGNAATARQTVETYMLYRAAELADRTGHPYFAIVEDETEREVDVDVYSAGPGFYGYGAGFGIGPNWGYPYYGTWGVAGPDPMVTTTDSYTAFATVEMLDSRPEGRRDVFTTQEVLTTLRPQIDFPEG